MISDHVYVLRNCREGGISHDGFVWPQSGIVEAPDWNPEPVCGGGLHGWLDATGDMSLGYGEGAPVWIVVRVERALVVDLSGKVKFPRGEVMHYGNVDGAVSFLASVGVCGYKGTATAGYAGTATAGTRGTATAGDAGTATAGDAGTATAGYAGTATAGYAGTATAGTDGTATAGYAGTATAGTRGTATAGYAGTATAGTDGKARSGERGEIRIRYWDQRFDRYRTVVGAIGEDTDARGNVLEPDVFYRLDDDKLFIKAEE